MKLLFDQNLSHRLVTELENEFPDSKHLRDFAMAEAEDWEVWAFAASNGFVITTKDSDFYQRSLIHGPPPKVLWIRIGNADTSTIVAAFRNKLSSIHAFENDANTAILIIT